MAEVAAEKGFKKKTTMQELAEHVFFVEKWLCYAFIE